MVLPATLITLIALPFLLLYYLILEPLYNGICILLGIKYVGPEMSYKKLFQPEKYEKEQSDKKNEEQKAWEASLLPDGKWKQLIDRKSWPDAYAVDGKAIYAAEGRVLLYVDKRVDEFDVPEGVENVYHCCFADCSELKRVSLPSTLKRIGKRAFDSCVSLKEIVVPESVYILDEGMFMNCSSLEHVESRGQVFDSSCNK